MTTAQPSYTPHDALLHTAACVERMRNELARVADAAPPATTVRDFADYVLAYVDQIFEGIQQHQVVHGVRGDRYTTGLPLSSIADLGGGYRWEKVWHPAPAHPSNSPRTLCERVPMGDGTFGTVIASAPGQLDVVRRKSS
ncbi:hypothetical protein MYCODSM44623_01704 [Mycobacterium intracellulare subsp. chimaera]|uniref:hypothetical protein n=1 Tax=Mycobacterium intracellulare TaxID=1767 RepID=UPI00093B033D|nr:hypothetical protein [Mycobacterium intracellulare]ASL08454.1 hypothetical protein MYCODSM44623_01704 [Mycobacterium intracellulare subsp. chimaera]MCV7324270.1 hypothetical protein [Mycobacterium intracellulare subsp. chimaera]ORV19982.1 hypothetical protein AWB97_24870 [Mycobacterium intracellulare subsp. chimaera]